MRRALGFAAASAALALVGALALAAPAAAQPTGITVLTGSVAQATDGNTLTLTQTSDVAIVEVTAFDIAAVETLQILAPTPTAVTVFRVVGGTESNIDGAVTSTGSLAIMSPDGITVGGSGSVNVDGDLVLVSGTAANTEFDTATPRFDVVAAYAPVVIAADGEVAADGSAALVAPVVRNEGFLGAGNGDLDLWSATQVTYDRTLRTFIVTGNAPMEGQYVESTTSGYQQSRHGTVSLYSAGPVIHDGFTVADNDGQTTGASGLELAGDVSSDALDAAAYGQFADFLGGQLGAFPIIGDAAALSADSIRGFTTGGRVPVESTLVMSGVEILGVAAPIIQVACGLDEAEPLEAHFAMAVPDYDGGSIVPSIDPYSTPNQPAVAVPGLGTVQFNEQTTTKIDGYTILEVTAMHIVTTEGVDVRVGTVSCGLEDVLPATGPVNPLGAVALAGLVALLGAALLVAARPRTSRR